MTHNHRRTERENNLKRNHRKREQFEIAQTAWIRKEYAEFKQELWIITRKKKDSGWKSHITSKKNLEIAHRKTDNSTKDVGRSITESIGSAPGNVILFKNHNYTFRLDAWLTFSKGFFYFGKKNIYCRHFRRPKWLFPPTFLTFQGRDHFRRLFLLSETNPYFLHFRGPK